jgi:hypothetical protein
MSLRIFSSLGTKIAELAQRQRRSIKKQIEAGRSVRGASTQSLRIAYGLDQTPVAFRGKSDDQQKNSRQVLGLEWPDHRI